MNDKLAHRKQSPIQPRRSLDSWAVLVKFPLVDEHYQPTGETSEAVYVHFPSSSPAADRQAYNLFCKKLEEAVGGPITYFGWPVEGAPRDAYGGFALSKQAISIFRRDDRRDVNHGKGFSSLEATYPHIPTLNIALESAIAIRKEHEKLRENFLRNLGESLSRKQWKAHFDEMCGDVDQQSRAYSDKARYDIDRMTEFSRFYKAPNSTDPTAHLRSVDEALQLIHGPHGCTRMLWKEVESAFKEIHRPQEGKAR